MGAEFWRKIVIVVPKDSGDAVSDFLTGLTGRGVIVEDAGGVVGITAYLPGDNSGEAIPLLRQYLDELAAMGALPDEIPMEVTREPEEDWMETFRSQHSRVAISDRIAVRPTWCAPENGKEIVLDPGLAFGTGSHATTRMCLTLMDRHIGSSPPSRLLDVGTGTGILAIAAAFLGIGEVLAVDVDPVSVRVARENTKANGVEKSVTVVEGSIEKASGAYDMITANLYSSLLTGLADPLCKVLAPGGILIASGMMEDEKETVIDAFFAAGLNCDDILSEDIWVAGLFTGLPQG
ncbi:MAG: 50S ribosomal protein L11 methyltransferase [Deltaproteobacteria bacterium]|nr:50S ribosomal protein L11 methyltransferase [Deltaproteobacteria bacterium]